MKSSLRAFCSFLAIASPVLAVEPLNTYIPIGNYPIAVSEPSGLTYNWDTNTLFCIGDEGEALVQFNKTGQFISSMAFDFDVSPRELRGLDDPEGVTYFGNNTFMIADERDLAGRVTTFQAGARRTQADLEPTSYYFDPNGMFDPGNSGLEGVAYDPIEKAVYGIKEVQPLTVFKMTGVPQITDVPGSPIVVTQPIATRNITRWGNNFSFDLGSDIYVLASSAAFPPGHPRRMNLLVLSRYANRVLEIDRAGNVIDSLDISALGHLSVEGLVMDNQGTLFLVSETGGLHVMSPLVPKFEILSQQFTREAGQVVGELTWDAVAGAGYVIEYTPDLASEWQTVSDLFTVTGPTGTATTQAIPDTGKGFFRVKKLAQ